MVVALPSWLSGVTPCDLVAFLFGLSAILVPRAEEFRGPCAELQAPCGAFSFSVPLVETLSSPPLSLCTKSWLFGDPFPAHAGSLHPAIDFRGIPQVIPADG